MAHPGRYRPTTRKWELLYRDRDIAVVNKGPGILSVKAPGRPRALPGQLAKYLNLQEKFVRPAHRLDEWTSGALLIALNPPSREQLFEQSKAREIEREYVAVLQGSGLQATGTLEHWLLQHPMSHKQKIVREGTPDAKHARLAYRVIASSKDHTLAAVKLETGRHHQIRVQFASIGFPLVGERVYDEPKKELFGRQALHARKLAFAHPRTGKWFTFDAPVAPDLARFIRGHFPGMRF